MSKSLRFLGPALGLVMVMGCGGVRSTDGGGAALTSRDYLGTQSPGDVWSWKIEESTFTAANETTGFEYAGSSSTLPTGFLKLVISSTNDPGVTVGSAAYAVELPGTAVVIKPMGADTVPPIVACALGSNPAGPNVSFNFVTVPSATWTPSEEAYGSVDFTVTGNDYNGVSNGFTIADLALTPNGSHFVGENGRMTEVGAAGGAQVTAAMTPSGVCILDYGPNLGGIIGVKQPLANIDLASLGSKSYRGFLINQGRTQCVDVIPNGDGTVHGAGYANPIGVETGTFDDGSGVTISFTAQPKPGLVRIDLINPGGSESLVVAVNEIGGKTMLFGFGAQPDDGSGYNFLLVEK